MTNQIFSGDLQCFMEDDAGRVRKNHNLCQSLLNKVLNYKIPRHKI